MRFGIVSPLLDFNDGQGRVNLEVAAEIVRQGHEVTVFAERIAPSLAASPQVEAVSVPPPPWLPSRLLRDQVLALRTERRLRASRDRCDAVLANGFVTWAQSDINAVHFVHAAWLRSRYHPWRLRRDARSLYARAYSQANALLERRALRRSRRIVAVSAQVRQELLRAGVPGERIHVIINGVDTEEFHPGLAEPARFGLPDAVPLALFAGDLKSPRKNLETVLRALSEVPDLHLAVAGRTDGSSYPAVARSMSLQDRVHFIGFCREMPALMRAADIFVFPSRYEACSLVLLEAMASGLPVVTVSTAGGAELVTPDAGTVLADSDDHHALAAALRLLAVEPARRHAMAEAARRQAMRHSWRAMAGRYVDLLREAVEERRRRADA
ncbi:MAG TPA: glycosyltransferase family 4 protein [Acetobacteraceae bacterium]|nr:glycosyltransferase family 4 protein [Acetobacteraceae bacterium]